MQKPMDDCGFAITTEQLSKTFYTSFLRRPVEAVRSISFSVKMGEIFGFLGPNGAGKTTTIKMLVGLIAPTGGHHTLFDSSAPRHAPMHRVGVLPENPYIYPALTPREFVALCAGLSGVSKRDTRKRVEVALERLGVAHAIDRPARTLSKGTLQRVGLAAAIVHGPELLILDEPMSGLDPVGRKEIRDLILEERKKGHTVFFSSHVLTDVEMLCDRVAIVRRGEVALTGTLHDLLRHDERRVEVTLTNVNDAWLKSIEALHVRRTEETSILEVDSGEPLRRLLLEALAVGATVHAVTPRRESLEDVFVRTLAIASDRSRASGQPPR